MSGTKPEGIPASGRPIAPLFSTTLCRARGTMLPSAEETSMDEDLFNAFQLITLDFALMASQHRELRKFAGIRKGLFG
jgi:hypothetical protein